jgi:hypothetical protein
MMHAEDRRRIDANLAVVRLYLKNRFPDYTITEMSVQNRYHMFVVTDDKLHQRSQKELVIFALTKGEIAR